MTDYPSMDRLAELQQMIADFAKVERVPPMGDTGRPENDVEHSFGLAITCWYLHSKIAPELDLLKILQYALAHDIVELHAGDTYAFDTARTESKAMREQDALKLVKNDWSDFKDLTLFAEKYIDKADDEARFVKAVDKLLPVIMIELDRNPKAFWKNLKVTLDMERDNKVSIKVSDLVAPYYDKLISWLDERGNLHKAN